MLGAVMVTLFVAGVMAVVVWPDMRSLTSRRGAADRIRAKHAAPQRVDAVPGRKS